MATKVYVRVYIGHDYWYHKTSESVINQLTGNDVAYCVFN